VYPNSFKVFLPSPHEIVQQMPLRALTVENIFLKRQLWQITYGGSFMASNHTTNYQLPKWEKTDRVQMKDFNDMTATLDAALKANADAIAETAAAFPLVKIKEVTLGADTAQWDIDVSDINFYQYTRIFLLPKLTGSSTDTMLRFDQITSGYSVQGSSYWDSKPYISIFVENYMDPRIELWHNNSKFCALTISSKGTSMNIGHGYILRSSLGQSGPTQLTFYKSNGTITGGQLQIYGLR